MKARLLCSCGAAMEIDSGGSDKIILSGEAASELLSGLQDLHLSCTKVIQNKEKDSAVDSTPDPVKMWEKYEAALHHIYRYLRKNIGEDVPLLATCEYILRYVVDVLDIDPVPPDVE